MYSLLDMLELTGRDVAPLTISAATVGLVFPQIAQRPSPSNRNLGRHLDRIQRSMVLNQLPIYFDRFGRLVGYVQWTQVNAAAAEQSLLKLGPDALDAGDLSDQGSVWILDFIALHGELPNILRDLRDNRLEHHATVAYFRYKRRRRMAKRVSRSDRTSFFRLPQPVPEHGPDWPLGRKDRRDLLHGTAATLDVAIELGRCIALMSAVDEFAAMPLPAVLNRVRAPLAQLQSRMYFSQAGEPTAFMTWAWLDRATMTRQPLPAPQALAPFEWNEGETLCLCDAVATPAGMRAMAADLSGAWFASEDLWVYPRTATIAADRPGLSAFACWPATRRIELADRQAEGSVVSDVASMLWREGAVSCLD